MSARTTISIPEDLKRRMEAAEEPVNWSAVASAAFEAKLAEIVSRKQEKTMDDVVQRLRASKLSAQSEDFAKGKEAGESWAREDATWQELQRLERAGDSDHWLSAERPGASFLFVISPETFDGQDPCRSHRPCPREVVDAIGVFWLTQVGSEAEPSEEVVRGFLAGAMAVFGEVRDRI